MKYSLLQTLISAALLSSSVAFADDTHSGGIHAGADPSGKTPDTFDIVHARITAVNNVATFHMAVSDKAGTSKPVATGKLAGSNVFSYVWPTSLNSADVGFEKDAGILALAVTAHADFDDTPLYDENADNDPSNDGNVWHSHWVVLQGNDKCGKGMLAVVDIPKGTTPKLPKTWPGLPILLDSPGWNPLFNDESVEVKVAFDSSVNIKDVQYDGVTAGLRVNQSVHAPLLCVVDVMDVASGDLSLPGRVD